MFFLRSSWNKYKKGAARKFWNHCKQYFAYDDSNKTKGTSENLFYEIISLGSYILLYLIKMPLSNQKCKMMQK